VMMEIPTATATATMGIRTRIVTMGIQIPTQIPAITIRAAGHHSHSTTASPSGRYLTFTVSTVLVTGG